MRIVRGVMASGVTKYVDIVRVSSRMLKKSLFSPTRPWRAETRLFPWAFSHRSEAQPKEGLARRSECLKVFIRSPRSIARANGPHEVRFVPPRLFARCSLAWDKARLGAPGLGG